MLLLAAVAWGKWAFAAGGEAISREPGGRAGDAGCQDLTLDRALELAIEGSPALAALKWEAKAAEAEVREVAAERWPVLRGEASYGYAPYGQRLVPVRDPEESAIFTDHVLAGGLVVSAPLTQFGGLRQEIRGTRWLAEADGAHLERFRQELVHRVHGVFADLLAERRAEEALRASKRALADHRRHTESLVKSGKAAPVALLRVDTRIADLELEAVQARGRRTVLVNELGTLLGLSEAPCGVEGDLELKDEFPSFDEALAAALSQRPDLREARARAEARDTALSRAKSELLPTLAANGSYGVRADPAGEVLPVASAGLALDVPLLEGTNLAAIRTARARLAAAHERIRSVELQIREDVSSARADAETARAGVEASRRAVVLGRESLDQALRASELGKIATGEVLDVQADLLRAEYRHARALASLQVAVSALELAMGGLP